MDQEKVLLDSFPTHLESSLFLPYYNFISSKVNFQLILVKSDFFAFAQHFGSDKAWYNVTQWIQLSEIWDSVIILQPRLIFSGKFCESKAGSTSISNTIQESYQSHYQRQM